MSRRWYTDVVRSNDFLTEAFRVIVARDIESEWQCVGAAFMATAETIRVAWQAQPFQPFALRLVDGTQYEVNGREWISLPPSPRAREVLYYVAVPGDPDRFQQRWIDLNLIAEVILPSSAKPGSTTNGPT